MAEIRSYIENGITADIQVTVEDLDNISEEFDLNYISLNKHDPLYMRGDEINITDNDYNSKTFLLPKKKSVTIDWVIDKINSLKKNEKAYKNLSKKFKKISDKYADMNIYPTSYGIGIHTVFTDTDNEFKEILDIFDNADIDYTLEWSNAFWVKRIKLSKSKSNIEKIEALKI